jgi:eukaryotic-like serine/threonine-protein kinase
VNPQRWQQIKVALDQALELEGDLRIAYIDQITANDAELRGELQALIAAHDEAGETFLNTPAAIGFGDLTDPDPLVGKHLGSYQLIELIGSGGMGEVYRAIRADNEYTKQVAIKLIRTDQSSAQLIRRFKNERQILASFDHANIARMFDGGTTEDGVPYFVMELIEGEPIDQYCEGRNLDVPARLGIFLEVCAAVHYAHQRLVIHRDLKPNNILVSANAEPKLLDFGIAKILTPSAQPEAVGADGGVGADDKTKTEIRLLTPEYASPEQINGEPLTTESDVYSLGVVLYQLLAGRRPFELKDSTRRALEEAVLATDPRPPSQIAGRNRIRRELDNIVLKALKKQPRDRYATANDLADDLRHFLSNEPVSAKADSIWYRAGQFTSGNRSSLQTAALGGALIALLLLSAGWWWRVGSRNDSAASAANQALSNTTAAGQKFAPPAHSIAVLPFINLSGDANQDYFSDGISEEMLNSLSRVDQLQVAARTSSFSFKGTNTDILEIARKLNVGAILEGSVRRAGDTVRITVQLINGENGFHVWSQSYDRDLADILAIQTDVASSVARQLEVELVDEEVGKIEVGGTRNPAAYDALLHGMQIFSTLDIREAPLRAALSAFDRAISLDPGYAAAHAQRARVLNYLAIFVAKPEERAGFQKGAYDAAQRAVALAPEFGEAHAELGQVLAYALLDFRRALPEFDRAIVLAPGSARVQAAAAGFYTNLGLFDRGIVAARRAVRLDPQNYQTHVTLGFVLHDARHYEEAIAALQHAEMLNPKSHYAQAWLVEATLAAGQNERARQRCELNSMPLDEDIRHECLAVAYHALGRQTQAQEELTRMMALNGDRSALNYAGIYAQWGNTATALKWLSKAEQLHDPLFQQLKVWWELDPIRQEPEFKAVEARMNFPP